MISSVLAEYGLDHKEIIVETLTSGLINRTWKVTKGNQSFILQKINHHVFKKPMELADNIRMIDQYLMEHSPSYLFVSPIKSVQQKELVHDAHEGYFRLFPFVAGSHTIDVVSSPEQAYEASLQFGKFTKLLSKFNADKLHITIPDFHNLTLRYHQFEDSLKNGNAERIKQSAEFIAEIKKHYHIVDAYEKVKVDSQIRHRVTHHDTKISNVLFNDQSKGLCVIDLDTVMPGYFISDVGDMMRTYLSPANEEEKDFCKIEVREDFFRAIVQGYLSCMHDELTSIEKQLILYAGSFLIYMQTLRFLTDYFNNDSYYGARYEEQNFVRAVNQLSLLKGLEDKSDLFQAIIRDELAKTCFTA
jgi:Ser/Thr protein kinase RdoA (MazF antagonist)